MTFNFLSALAIPIARSARNRPEQGFSLLEMVIALTLIGILIAIAVDRLPVWQIEAERTAAEGVAGSLRSALGIKVASHIARNELAAIPGLEGSNPMAQLAEIPSNYAGERRLGEAADVAAGQWYFDTTRGELVYRVRSGYAGSGSSVAEVRYAVRLVFTDRNRNGRFDAGRDELEGVRLEQIEGYAWPVTGQAG
jgi:prepilin-type N-terminal cleavage/methylation domain-containing protein